MGIPGNAYGKHYGIPRDHLHERLCNAAGEACMEHPISYMKGHRVAREMRTASAFKRGRLANLNIVHLIYSMMGTFW